MAQDDHILVEQYRAGDVAALETLVERYRRPLYAFILHSVSDGSDADEVFQEVWFRVIRKIGRYRHRNFSGWLFRICRNLIVDRSRRRKRLVSLSATAPEPQTQVDVPAPDPAPWVEAAEQDLGRRIRAVVNRLPPAQREVFLLRVEADLTFREIAGIQKVSINMALARMQYALTKLRPALQAEYESVGGPP